MNQALVDKIAAAVLYEGYILYPYRPSLKNRQRWTFGGLYPQAYSLAHGETDAWSMQTECLVHGDARTRLEIKVRFLHPMARLVGKITSPGIPLERTEGDQQAGADNVPKLRLVDSLEIDGRLWHPWQEAVEREVALGAIEVEDLTSQAKQEVFHFPAQSHWQ